MITQLSLLRRMRAYVNSRATDSRGEDGVALLTAIMFMIIMAGITTVLLSVVMNQIVPSYLSQKSTKTINAAQAGMQTALGTLRSIGEADFTGAIYGDPGQLPCSLKGQVNAQAADGITYTVAFTYYSADPTGQTASYVTSHTLACSASGVATQPKWVLIVANGLSPAVPGVSSATTGNRSLAALYKFRVTNVNNPGGRIYDANSSYCVQAVTATAGAQVKFQALAQCTDDDRELWIYDTDYEIKLASTTVGGLPGLCITGPAVDGQATQNALLQACKPKTDSARWNQLWSWTGENSWHGQKKVIANGPSDYCLSTGYDNGTVISGKNLLVASSCKGGFAPATDVGAGAAGYSTHQIVNYLEFGRCADVTGENINTTYLISYPCKQDPTGTGNNLLWNHKWYYTEPPLGTPTQANQQIYIYYQNNVAQKYCMVTPATGGSVYPVFATCDTSARQKWNRVYDTGTYLTSYLFTDTYGRCLTANSADRDGSWSKVTVATCNGSDAQKWNAPPSYSDSTVGGYREVFQ